MNDVNFRKADIRLKLRSYFFDFEQHIYTAIITGKFQFNKDIDLRMHVKVIQCLGLFEECYSLLRDDVINKEDFLSAHLWVLERILENKDVQVLVRKNKKYWIRLEKLVNMFPNDLKFHHIFE